MAQASFLKNYKQWIVWKPAQTPPFYEVWELAGDTFLDATVARPLKIHTQKTPECITGLLEGRLRYDDNTGIYTLTRDIRQPDTEIFFKENPKKNADGALLEEINGQLKLQLKKLPDYANSVQQLLEISKLQTPIQDYLKTAKLFARSQSEPRNKIVTKKTPKPAPDIPKLIPLPPNLVLIEAPLADKEAFKRVRDPAACGEAFSMDMVYSWNFNTQTYDKWVFYANNSLRVFQKDKEITYYWKFWDKIDALLLRTKKQRITDFTQAYFIFKNEQNQLLFQRVDKEQPDFVLFGLKYASLEVKMQHLNPETYPFACKAAEAQEAPESLADKIKDFFA
jgi:hypothetical protein